METSDSAGAMNHKAGVLPKFARHPNSKIFSVIAYEWLRRGMVEATSIIPNFNSTPTNPAPSTGDGAEREGTIVNRKEEEGTTTAEHQHTLLIRGAPPPCYPTCPAELRQTLSTTDGQKMGVAPVLRGRTAPKRRYPAPSDTRAPIDLRGRKAQNQTQ